MAYAGADVDAWLVQTYISTAVVHRGMNDPSSNETASIASKQSGVSQMMLTEPNRAESFTPEVSNSTS